MFFSTRPPAQTTFYPSPQNIFAPNVDMSDRTGTYTNTDANGSICSWPSYDCAEPPKSN
ncbi:hypothetical protein WOLCODRAFT_147973 [Wolfiporia cocos MD-104 SS10]|uniref:Uncharacterized protein n=1 Tax=Wolfiporia cocos (strain MD-104) TaxID=742152 RepID=A0A2H3IV84_WOLCO|nr:hypothetical protein WOLCODRAFT_147973 [Wolfiporia cocos MD-104 SS10]